MNFVGHIKVAIDQVSGPGGGHDGDLPYLVGAALPDVAAMGRFRLTSRSGDRGVQDGVTLHHRTDDEFHRHPWFRENSKVVTTELNRLGLGRGAARAVGHVGVELLLDGFLLDETDGLGTTVSRAMGAMADPTLELSGLVADDRRPDWSHHLRRTADWPLPSDYRDPAAVAYRLQRILTRRPRLGFGPDKIPMVEVVLAERQQQLESGAPALLDDLKRQVSRPPGTHSE